MSLLETDNDVHATVLSGSDDPMNSSQEDGSLRSLRIVEDDGTVVDDFDERASQITLDLNPAPPKPSVFLGMYLRRPSDGSEPINIMKPRLDHLSTITTEKLLNKNSKRRCVEEQSKSSALNTINSESICALSKAGMAIYELSTKFGVPKHTITKVIGHNTPNTNNTNLKRRSKKYPVICNDLKTLHSEAGPSLQPNEALTKFLEKDMTNIRKKSTVLTEDEEDMLVKEAVDKCMFCPTIYEGTPTDKDRRYHLDEKCLGVLKLINQISKEKKNCTSQQFNVLDSHFKKSDSKIFCKYCNQEIYPFRKCTMTIARHFHLHTKHPEVQWDVKNLKREREQSSSEDPKSIWDMVKHPSGVSRSSSCESSPPREKTYMKFYTADPDSKNLRCMFCKMFFKKDPNDLNDHIRNKCVPYQKYRLREKEKNAGKRREKSRSSSSKPGSSSKRSPEPESSSRSKPRRVSDSSSPNHRASPGRALQPMDQDVSTIGDEAEIGTAVNSELHTVEVDQEAAAKIIKDLMAAGILINMKKSRRCAKCARGKLELVTCKSRDQWQWICDRCGANVGVRSGTFLEEHDISLKTFQKLLGLHKEGKSVDEAEQVLQLSGDLTRKLFHHLEPRPVKNRPSPKSSFQSPPVPHIAQPKNVPSTAPKVVPVPHIAQPKNVPSTAPKVVPVPPSPYQCVPSPSHTPPLQPVPHIKNQPLDVIPGVIKTEPLDEPAPAGKMFQTDPSGKLCAFHQLLGDSSRTCGEVTLLNNTLCLRHDNKLRMKKAREIAIPKRKRANFPMTSSASSTTSSTRDVQTPPPTSVAAPVSTVPTLPTPTLPAPTILAPAIPTPVSVFQTLPTATLVRPAPVSTAPTLPAPASAAPASAAPVSAAPTIVNPTPPPPTHPDTSEELDELPDVLDNQSESSDGIDILPDPDPGPDHYGEEGVSISIRIHHPGREIDSQTDPVEFHDSLVQTEQLETEQLVVQKESTVQTDPISNASVETQHHFTVTPEPVKSEPWEGPTISIDLLMEPIDIEVARSFQRRMNGVLKVCEELGLRHLMVLLWNLCHTLRDRLTESVNYYFRTCGCVANLLNVIEGRLYFASKSKREEVEEEMKSIFVKLDTNSLISVVRMFKVEFVFSETKPETLYRICSEIISRPGDRASGWTVVKHLWTPHTLIISLLSLAINDKNLGGIRFWGACLQRKYTSAGAVQKYILSKEYWCQMMKLEDDITWPVSVESTPEKICQDIFREHGKMSDQVVPLLTKHLKRTFTKDEFNELEQYLIKRSIIQPPAPVASSSADTGSSSVSSSVDTTTIVQTTSAASQCNLEEEQSLLENQINLEIPLVAEPLDQALTPANNRTKSLVMMQGIDELLSFVDSTKEELANRIPRTEAKLAREKSLQEAIIKAEPLLKDRYSDILEKSLEILRR